MLEIFYRNPNVREYAVHAILNAMRIIALMCAKNEGAKNNNRITFALKYIKLASFKSMQDYYYLT